jgi:hypothetical protein
VFGELSIGFHRSELEATGAVPVFYVPRSATNKRGNIGGFHVGRIYELLAVIRQVKQTDQTFTLEGRPISLTDLESFTSLLSTQYYPIEDLENDKDRQYFAQREWRIPGNLRFGRAALARTLTQEEAVPIAAIDPEFFSRTQRFPTGVSSYIQQTKLLPEVNGRRVRDAIVRMVTPARLEGPVRRLLDAAGVTPEIVVIPRG